MKLKHFQKLDGWSESLDRFAEEAIRVEDCQLLKDAAYNYLKAEEHFIKIMEKFGVELG